VGSIPAGDTIFRQLKKNALLWGRERFKNSGCVWDQPATGSLASFLLFYGNDLFITQNTLLRQPKVSKY
jgi:hypothetical protein